MAWRSLALTLISLLSSLDANATAVRFVWSGATGAGALGTSSIAVSGSQPETLTLDLVLDVDSAGLSNVALPIKFDPDLGDELNLHSIEKINWRNPEGEGPGNPPGTGSLFHGIGNFVTQESVAGLQEGQLFRFEAVTSGAGPTNVTLTFARIVFSTNPQRVLSDGTDVSSGPFLDLPVDSRTRIFRPGCCVFGYDITAGVEFGGASVDLIPEPASIALVALGIGALALAARRERGRR